MKLVFFLVVLPFCLCCQMSTGNKFTIHLVHMVDNQTLTIDSPIYLNNLRQPYTITKFKYYVSNIVLKSKKGQVFKDKYVYLVDEENPLSKKLFLHNTKNGNYDSIYFILGVDSSRNCSGAQPGALDPIHAMFWTWNTGYIFFKLEGKSPLSSAPGKIFEYHIGGYKEPVNAIQVIRLGLPFPLDFTKIKEQSISINVNIAELFRQPVDIDFAVLPSVTDSKNALLISRNYKDIFSIK